MENDAGAGKRSNDEFDFGAMLSVWNRARASSSKAEPDITTQWPVPSTTSASRRHQRDEILPIGKTQSAVLSAMSPSPTSLQDDQRQLGRLPAKSEPQSSMIPQHALHGTEMVPDGAMDICGPEQSDDPSEPHDAPLQAAIQRILVHEESARELRAGLDAEQRSSRSGSLTFSSDDLEYLRVQMKAEAPFQNQAGYLCQLKYAQKTGRTNSAAVAKFLQDLQRVRDELADIRSMLSQEPSQS